MWSDTWLKIHFTFVFANTILCAGVMAFLTEAISHFLRGLIVSCRKDEGFIAQLLYHYHFRMLKCCWRLHTKLTKFCILLLAKGLNLALSYRDLQKNITFWNCLIISHQRFFSNLHETTFRCVTKISFHILIFAVLFLVPSNSIFSTRSS